MSTRHRPRRTYQTPDFDMPPPQDGNEYIPFERLIRLERVSEDQFRSIALPFVPTGQDGKSSGVAYGGHVYMQAAWAACQTVKQGFLLSNVSGNFILPAVSSLKFTYHVLNIRDGRSYCTRIVNVSQKEDKGYVFTCTCVFKTEDTSPLDVQPEVKLWDKYGVSLEGKRPSDFPECSGYDVPWFWRLEKEKGIKDVFPGLDTRKADLAKYNQDKHPLDRRQLIFYRSIGTIPDDEPNMHLCAQLYASDRNSLFIVANAFDVGDSYTGMGSLVHQVIFHTGFQDLKFGPDHGEQKSEWFCKEDQATRFNGNRGLFYSRVWSPNGRHVMTITQDGMVKVPKDSTEAIKEIRTKWEGLKVQELEDVKRRGGKL